MRAFFVRYNLIYLLWLVFVVDWFCCAMVMLLLFYFHEFVVFCEAAFGETNTLVLGDIFILLSLLLLFLLLPVVFLVSVLLCPQFSIVWPIPGRRSMWCGAPWTN